MKNIQIRNIQIGSGMPKICVPITASSKNALLRAAESFSRIPADLAEWRADMYEGSLDPGEISLLLGEIRYALSDTPLLFTYRTTREGGNRPISDEDYLALNLAAIESSCIDIIDVELSSRDAVISELSGAAKAHGVRLMLSYHNFDSTPGVDEIISIYKRMQYAGADMSKVAVMPKSEDDVGVLLDAAAAMRDGTADRPYIAISMSELGLKSRIYGGFYGSCITYAAHEASSAPGQIDVFEMKKYLSEL